MDPAGIVTEVGTVAALVFELLKPTVAPPTGAGPEMETVPVTFVAEPPTMAFGETDAEMSPAA